VPTAMVKVFVCAQPDQIFLSPAGGRDARGLTPNKRLRSAPSSSTARTITQRTTLRPMQKSVVPHLARRSDDE